MDLKDIQNYKYKLSHVFHYHFFSVAKAFWAKYKEENMYNTITIAGIKQLEPSKFMFVRRIECRGKIEYERIVYDRTQPKIIADLFLKDEKTKLNDIAERCIYSWNSLKNSVDYNLIIVKDVWSKFLRTKVADWGIGRMEDVLKKTVPA